MVLSPSLNCVCDEKGTKGAGFWSLGKTSLGVSINWSVATKALAAMTYYWEQGENVEEEKKINTILKSVKR